MTTRSRGKAKDPAQERLQKIQDALQKAMALHAEVLVAQSELKSTSHEVEGKINAADADFTQKAAAIEAQREEALREAGEARQAIYDAENARVSAANDSLAKAEQALNKFRADTHDSLGIELPNYLAQAQSGGGSVRL